MPLILASTSPRRRELLGLLGVPFSVVTPTWEEKSPSSGLVAARLVRCLALSKAQAVACRQGGQLVLAADTMVVFRGQVLGKPASLEEATQMLTNLRARWHRVITGVALLGEERMSLGHAQTWVHMRPYTRDELERYLLSGEPLDKAGAYAIQDPHFRPVDRYLGCYCNVVGLPLALVASMLRRRGVPVGRKPPLPQCHQCPLWAKL